MTIAICLIGGVVAAVCGCGDQKKGYHSLFKQTKKDEPIPAAPLPLICGGTRIKMNRVTCWRKVYRETPILPKHQRETIRGKMA